MLHDANGGPLPDIPGEGRVGQARHQAVLIKPGALRTKALQAHQPPVVNHTALLHEAALQQAALCRHSARSRNKGTAAPVPERKPLAQLRTRPPAEWVAPAASTPAPAVKRPPLLHPHSLAQLCTLPLLSGWFQQHPHPYRHSHFIPHLHPHSLAELRTSRC
eukprot:1140253-Pelagomonas_calceolata.AAC.2